MYKVILIALILTCQNQLSNAFKFGNLQSLLEKVKSLKDRNTCSDVTRLVYSDYCKNPLSNLSSISFSDNKGGCFFFCLVLTDIDSLENYCNITLKLDMDIDVSKVTEKINKYIKIDKLNELKSFQFTNKSFSSKLLYIENNTEMDLIWDEYRNRTKNSNIRVDTFRIGLNHNGTNWYWLDGKQLNQTVNYSYSSYLLENSFRKKGFLKLNDKTVNLTNIYDQRAEGYACRFVLDHCKRKPCQHGGRCINYVVHYSCDCTLFYEGHDCEHFNSQFKQCIIITVIISVMILFTIGVKIYRNNFANKKCCCSDDSSSTTTETDDADLTRENAGYVLGRPESELELCFEEESAVKEKEEMQNTCLKRLKCFHENFKPFYLVVVSGIITFFVIFHIDASSSGETNEADSFFCNMTATLRNTFFDSRIVEHLPTFSASLILTIIINFIQVKKVRIFDKINIYVPKFQLAMNPYDKTNRLDSIVVFISYGFNIIFIITVFTLPVSIETIKRGVLVELLLQIAYVFLLGLTYYPILTIINIFTNISKVSARVLVCVILCNIYCAFLLVYNMQISKSCPTNTTIEYIMDTLNKLNLTDKSYITKFQQFKKFDKIKKLTNFVNKSSSMFESTDDLVFDHRNTLVVFFFSIIYLQLKLSYLLIRYVLLIFINDRRPNSSKSTDLISWKYENEYNYARKLFIEKFFNLYETTDEPFKCSQKWMKKLTNIFLLDIYQPWCFFRYSKHVLNLYMIALVFLYCIGYFILYLKKVIRHFLSPIKDSYLTDLSKLPIANEKVQAVFGFMKTFLDIVDEEFSTMINATLFISLSIYLYQLGLSLRNYKRTILYSFAGKYKHIPMPERLSNVRLIVSSIHYSGYFLAYVFYGFLTFTTMILAIVAVFRVVFRVVMIFQYFTIFILPIVAIFLLKYALDRFLARNCFLRGGHRTNLELNNIKSYYTFLFFTLFYDCFLGFVECSMRFSKIMVVNLINMPRLDLGIFGRRFELFDKGYLSYISFLYLESFFTNPLKIVFLCLLNRYYKIYRHQFVDRSAIMALVRKRPKKEELLDLHEKQENIKKKWLMLIYAQHIRELNKIIRHRRKYA